MSTTAHRSRLTPALAAVVAATVLPLGALVGSTSAAAADEPAADASTAARVGPGAGAGPGVDIRLDPSYQQPEFQGWGTALTWFANVTGGWPQAKKAELADALFGEDGLQFTIARYNIGGGDSPETPAYMRPGAAIPGFWNRPASVGPVPGSTPDTPRDTRGWWDPANPADWNWDADANQRWWLKAAKARGATTFEAFSNSAPYFMTESGYASGNVDGNKDNLRADQYDEFATYLATVVDHVEKADGIDFATVSPVNEPNTNYWHAKGGQEGSHWDPASQGKMAVATRAALDAVGSDAVVASPDETNPGTFGKDWAGWNAAARAAVGRLNVHTYGTDGRLAPRDLSKLSGKDLWMSEVDLGPGGIPQNFEDMRPGLALAQRISEDISQLEPRAWVTWQSVENYRNMLPSAENQNWGLIQVDFLTDAPGAEPIRKNKKYWTMAQYSRFIKPGDHVIHTDNADTVAAIRPGDSSATVVYTNDSDQAVPVRVDLGGFAQVRNGMAQTISTTADHNLAKGPPAQVRDGVLAAMVEPGSVTTFALEGVSGVAKAAALHASTADSLVVNQNSGKALSLATDGTSLVQRTPSSTDPAQRWRISRATDGWTNREQYTLVNTATGKELSTTSSGALRAIPSAASPADRWTLSVTPDGRTTLLSGTTESVLDVGGQSTADGASVGLWTPTAGSNQQWFLRGADVTRVAADPVLTPPGTAPVLPDTVAVTYGDGRTESRAVTWASVPKAAYANSGRFSVTGGVAGLTERATATVFVSAVTGTSVSPVKTAVGVLPTLPASVTGRLAIGGTLPLDVLWDAVSASSVAAPGKFSVRGVLPATGDTTTVLVQVNPPAPVNLALNTGGAAFPKATATFTGQYDSTAAVLDGVVSSRRWTNWDPNAWRPADTLAVDLGSARTVSSVRLDLFDDQGGTRPPATADLQRQDPATGEWVSLTDGPTPVTDGQVVLQRAYAGQLQRVRVVMTARPGTCIAVAEFSVFGPGASTVPSRGTDATLESLSVGGKPVAGFEPATLSYAVDVGGDEVPVVSAVASDPFATVTVTAPKTLPGEALVVVTAEDTSATSTYRVALS
jgi:O-glycosyl hydrolase